MALKGTTKIELTNVKTGEKEVIQKDNLVTNAVPDLISIDPGGYRLAYAGEKVFHDLTPICPNSIGGILCYENPLEENPDKYYAEPDNPLIACSSNDVNSGTSALRGSMNQTESGPLEDGSGYRFVFDFSTSQGNGNISAVALTHKYGGVSGWGDEVTASFFAKTLCSIVESNSIPNDILSSRVASAVNVISYNEARQELESLYIDEFWNLVIEKYRLPIDSIGLLADSRLAFPTRQTERTVLQFPDDFVLSKSGEIAYIAFVDGGDGSWYGFSWDQGSTTTTASVVKISKADYAMEAYNYTISGALLRSGTLAGWKESGNTYYHNNSLKNVTIANGFLYAIGTDYTTVHKIMMESGIVVATYTKTLKTDRTSYSNYPPNINICALANRVITNGLLIEGENAHQTAKSLVIRENIVTNEQKRGALVHVGPYLIEYQMYRYNHPYTLYSVIRILTPYLATINNLPTPVEKTADKTMKITYILREES